MELPHDHLWYNDEIDDDPLSRDEERVKFNQKMW